MRGQGPLRKMSINVGPNMTPMVDIVLCILIFFMLGAGLAVPEMFLTSNTAVDKAGLGKEVTNAQMPAVRMNIVMTRRNDVTYVKAFEADPIAMESLDDPVQSGNELIKQTLLLKKKHLSDDVQVIIVPEKLVPYQDVITVYNDCVGARYKQVAFAAAQG
ncbi:MAG TPA: biopolymer transporter ExbD [Phycisphaerae bacterium]|nr:biopolymer transporter ExbD [Phycisphaerae bacterium]